MKRTFLAKRNALFTSTNFSWGAGALVCVMFVLLVRLLAPNLFWYAFTPVFRAADALAAKSHNFISSFGNAATLSAENQQLADKNAALALENQTLSQKIDGLSSLIGTAAAPAKTTGIIAGVVARPPESPYDTLVLSGGTNEGVMVGQEAFGNGGVPLGIVGTVTAHFSRVTLFSAPNVATGGWVGGKNLPLTIRGAGGGVLTAYVARAAGVAAGDTVFVPGPGKLPIGVVTRVDDNPSFPQVTLRIVPSLNLFSIAWVELRDTGAGTILFAPLQSATSTPQ